MQNDFVTGSLANPAAKAIVPKIAKKIEQYEKAGDKIIFTRDTHDSDYLNTSEGKNLPIPHCIFGSEGWCFPVKIRNVVFNKKAVEVSKSTFGSVGLPDIIKNIIIRDYIDKTVESIEIVGLCTDICVISNALILKAAFPETEIIVDSSCCAGTTPENHKAALKVMQSCRIKII
jgi:nicotinamidase-related amidase